MFSILHVFQKLITIVKRYTNDELNKSIYVCKRMMDGFTGDVITVNHATELTLDRN